MKKISLLILFLMLILFSSAFSEISGKNKLSKVEKEVIENILQNESYAEVVVKIKEDSKLLDFKKHSRDKIKYISKNVSLKELEDLNSDKKVERIFSKFHVRAFLIESTKVVLSNNTNYLKINSSNLTGTNQTVCIIDTGVNFNHPDLRGKNSSCVIDCFNKACVANCSIGDDNGHGTHIAGIVAASGGIYGIATNVSLIAVKILDANGDGGNDENLNNAIDYCVAQNVSVISMSLGTSAGYSSECDNVAGMSAWRNSVNAATVRNISVVIASGNDGNTTHISSPACLANATAVADTYDANIGGVSWGSVCTDLTTSVDKIVCHANRNSLVRLFAPGALINSTYGSTGYLELGGTSMSTPMVSGSIAIIKQVLNMTNQKKNITEIEDILYNTGKKITEGSNNFSRINLYNATLFLDNISPNITLISPENNNLNLTNNQTFICNITDWQLSNITFQIWNSSNLYYNETKNISGITNQSTFNLTNMSENIYVWNCLGRDLKGNFAYSSNNFTITIGGVSVSLLSPSNQSYTNQNLTNFTCRSSSDQTHNLSNSTIKIWNLTNFLIYNETKNISGLTNDTNFNYTFILDGNYSWNCLATNNVSNSSESIINYTLIFDTLKPLITNVSTSKSSSSATISWTTSEESNSSINNSIIQVNSSSFTTSHSLEITGLSASTTYTHNITSCDRAGNCNTTENIFTTESVTVSSSSSGGSGGSGGGGGSRTTNIQQGTSNLNNESTKSEELNLTKGIEKELKKGDKINFKLSSKNHSLTLININKNNVDLILESDPINLTISVGQEIKLNLSSVNYLDLYLKLNNISNDKVNITIREIYEEIKISNLETEERINSSLSETIKERISNLRNPIDKGEILISVSILILALAIFYLAYEIKKRKKLKTKDSK